jgi:hypothetical protein
LAYAGKANQINEIWSLIKDRLPPSTFPIASDPFGNYICFRYDRDTPVVVFWDHEKAVGNAQRSVVKICNTFTELLDRLYEPE